MLSVSAQHSRKHRKQQKTAVAQSVEPQTTVKGKGKKAVNAINNNHAVAPATPVKGQKPIVEKLQTQPQPKGKQQQGKLQHQQQLKGQQPQVKGQQPQLKGQPAQVKGQQVVRGKGAVRNAHVGKKGAKGPAYVTTEEIKGLQQQNLKLQKEISEHEEEMKVKQKDVDDRLQKIVRLDTEIGQHQRTIDTIATDIKGLDSNIGILKGQLASLEAQLGERRARFIRSMRYMARHRSIQDKLMFVFSAKNLTQMYRRLRFVREYAAYQRAQGEQLKAKQMQVDEKHTQLKQVRVNKSNLLYKDRQVHAQMERKRVEQQTVVSSLQNDQKVLQGVIAQRRQQQQALNAQIDRLIQIEIQKARERAIAEAKAQAAARAAAAKKRAEELARKKAAAEAAARENARRIAEAKEREAKAKAAARAAAEAARRLVRKPLLVLLQPELLQKRHVKRLCRRSVLLLVSVLFVRQKSRKLLLRLHKKRLRLVLLLRRLVPTRWRVRLKQIVWLPNARLMPTVNVLLVRLKLQELLLLKTMICSVLPIVR